MSEHKPVPARRAPIPLPKVTDEEIYALQALERGEANPEQQKFALKWIVEKACDLYGFCDQPDNDRLCAIHDGRRFAGSQIVKAISLNMEVFKSTQRSNSPKPLTEEKPNG